MKDERKTKKQLINELVELRQRIAQLAALETEGEWTKENLKRYQYMVESAHDAIFFKDLENRYIIVNDKTLEAFGLPREQVVGKNDYEIMPHKEEAKKNIEDDQLVFKSGKPREITKRMTGKNGKEYWFEAIKVPQFDNKGNIIGLVGIARDITQRKRMEESLRESEEKYRTLVTNIPDVTWTADSKGNTTFISPNVEKVYGYNAEEIYKEGERLWFGRIHPDELEKAKQAFDALFEKGIRLDIDYRIRRKDGNWIWVHAKSITTYEKDGVMYADGLFSDISERKQTEETMRYLAYHDLLTGLPNPFVFNDRLAVALLQAERNQQNLAVMSLDLDYFKDVNDTLGHQVGDQLLRHVGRRLRNLLRKSDTVARLGGDEFMLLMPVIARVEDAGAVAKKILEAFRKPFAFDSHEINITTSVGIAIYPNDGKDAGTIIRNADAAMYRAKRKGRDNYQRFSSATDPEALV